jgi:hypothetical protein
VEPFARRNEVDLRWVFDRYGCGDYAGVVDEYARVPKPRRPVPLPT